MRYHVTKIDKNGREYDYGILCEDDMKYAVQGYRQKEDEPELYVRKHCRTVYIVEPMNED